MTDIVPAPDVRLSSEFPTNADRTAGVFNTKSNSWAITSRTMAADTDAAAKSARTNAIAANERAEAADASADDALAQANRAEGQADAAMGYRNTAGSHAATAAAQAGIATAKAQEAAASAAQTNADKNATQIAAQKAVTDSAAQVALATTQAVRAEEAAASISGGPITSLNVYSGLKTGAVTLELSDLSAQATDAQMQAGALETPLLMSPSGVKAAVLANSRIQRVARTSNTQLQASDSGKWIDITSGTFTQTFAAAATLASGWWCYLRNSGTGDITLDPNASELIDGLISYIMYPGEVRLVQCDGAALRTIVITPYFKAFTSSDTYVKPPGYRVHAINAWKGGAAGNSGGFVGSSAEGNVTAAAGVGSSLYEAELPDTAVPATVSIIVGSGGVAAPASASNTRPAPSSAPGNTAFGSLLSTASWLAKFVTASGFPTIAGSGGDAGPVVDVYGSTTSHIGLQGTSTATSDGGKGGNGAYRNQQSGVISPATAGENGYAPGGGGGGGGSGSNISSWATKPPGQKGGDGARGELRIWGVI